MKKNDKFNQIDTRLHNQSEWLEFLRKEEQRHHLELKDKVSSLELKIFLIEIFISLVITIIIISYIYNLYLKGTN